MNTGFLKFDADIEMGDIGVFNTTGSKLWQRIVLLFQAELQEQYALMRQDRFTVDNIMKYVYDEQISQIPAVYYNVDMQKKYLDYGSSYLYALHGSGEKHIKRWIRERIMYCDTLLKYNVTSADYITLRSSKLGYVYLDIQTYIPMYVSVKWRDEVNNTGMQTKRVGRGETVRFEYNMPTATDQEILVYAGYYLKSLGDVSNLQPTSMLIANASRLTEIECHSPNLINTDLSECKLLQRIDLSDSTALGTGIGAQPILNIQNCNYLRYCNCLNTQLTAIYTKQAGGNLEEIYYPSSTQVIQLTNQTHLKIVGIPKDENAPKSLAQVEISNCNNVEYLQYPFTEGEDIIFDSLKYVQTLSLTNSLDKLKEMSFTGFSKLKTVELNSLPNLEKIQFEDMLPSSDISTLENITVSDCPLITDLSFKVSSNDYKFAFVENGKMDLGGLYSLKKIESNTDVIGLNTLIIPTSLKELKFTNEYSTGINDLKSIWSASANHFSDGFVGIDLLDVNLTYIDMANLSIEKGINFHISPTEQHPNLNTYRDGKTKPYFRPEGSMDLTNYTGEMACMYKGIDFTKLQVTTPPNTNNFIYDISGLFEGAIFNKNIVDVMTEINKYPNETGNWSNLFKDSISDIEPTDVDIPTDKPMILTSMYENTNITQDISLPSNVVNVDNMFKDCKLIMEYEENWYNEYDNEISHIDCYKGTGNDRYVPVAWGGEGFVNGYISEITVEIPTDNYEFTLTNNPDVHLIGDRVIEWGDGSTEILTDSYTHVYAKKGTYTIKGNFVLGRGKEPSNSIKECLTEVHMMADIISNLSYAFSGCKVIRVLDFDTSNVTDMGAMFYGCNQLTTLDVSNFNTTNVTDMYAMFHTCSNLTSLDLSSFDTSNVTSMVSMFQYCNNLTSLNLSNWDVTNVTDMKSMFNSCKSLTSLDISNFDTSNVTNMGNMFRSCTNLISLNLSNFNTSNVTTISNMFEGCNNLTTLNLSNFNTTNVTDMNRVFYSCNNLTTLDVSNWDTTNATNINNMFDYCNNLKTLKANNMIHSNPKLFTDTINNGYITELIANNWTINNTSLAELFKDNTTIEKIELKNFNTTNVTNMDGMFFNCNNLTSLDVSNWNTSKVISMIYMFFNCNNLTTLDLSNFNTSNVTSMSQMFYNCNNLTTLDVSNFDTSKVTSMSQMFYNCNNLTSLDVSNWDTSKVTDMGAMFQNCNNLTSLDLSNFNTTNVTSMYNMFAGCNNLISLDVSNFNTTNVTSMSSIFYNCQKLTTLDVSNFDTSKVNNMGYMFSGCTNLTTLDVKRFDTSKVTNMSGMFHTCNNLTTLDLSNFNTSKVTNISQMFEGCNQLTTLDVSNFNTTNVTDMNRVFHTCNNLTTLDLSNWNTSNVTNMGYMFEGCNQLTTLDVSNFNTTNVTDMNRVFHTCNNLTTLDLSNWNTSNVTNMGYMFYECKSLQELYLTNWTNVTQTQTAINTLPNGDDAKNEIYTRLNVTPQTGWTIVKPSVVVKYKFNNTLYADLLPEFNVEFVDYIVFDETTEIDDYGNVIKTRVIETIKYNPPTLIRFGCRLDDQLGAPPCNIPHGGVSSANALLEVIECDSLNINNYVDMFRFCKNLKFVNLQNVSLIKPVATFEDCLSLITLNINDWDTSKATSMNYMFANCNNLTSLDVSNFDTSNVTDMNGMFSNCTNLTTLNVKRFNTSKVTNMGSMFYNCSNLTSLDVGNFDTTNVTSMDYMFNGCNSLQELYLTNWLDVTQTQTAINTLPNGDDVKNEIYTKLNVTPQTGWTIVKPFEQNVLDIINE